MKNNYWKIALLSVNLCFASVTHAHVFESELMLLLVGPVSEAAQEAILLVRRGENFISAESLMIGCIAGGASGMMVSAAPALGLFSNGLTQSVGVGYVMGASILSCMMTVVGSAAGMFTASILQKIREAPANPLPNANQLHP